MKTILALIPILIFATLSFANNIEDVYKEQWNKYTMDKTIITESLKTCEDSMNRFSRFALDRRRIHDMPENVAIQGMITMMQLAVASSNKALHGTREDATMQDINDDMQLMKKRSMDIDDKLFDLKIKITKEFGSVPEWCK